MSDDRALVLVTGGTGYLGGHTLARLPADGHRVRTTVRDLGAVRVLAAAREAGVRRVVLTSSFAAVGYSAAPRAEYTEADWTDLADPNSAYVRSKVIAERAAWEQVRVAGGPELAVINPAGIFGPVLGGRLSSSVSLVRAMLDGAVPVVPPLYFGVADVRDVADLHVRAMTHPRAAGAAVPRRGRGADQLPRAGPDPRRKRARCDHDRADRRAGARRGRNRSGSAGSGRSPRPRARYPHHQGEDRARLAAPPGRGNGGRHRPQPPGRRGRGARLSGGAHIVPARGARPQ